MVCNETCPKCKRWMIHSGYLEIVDRQFYLSYCRYCRRYRISEYDEYNHKEYNHWITNKQASSFKEIESRKGR